MNKLDIAILTKLTKKLRANRNLVQTQIAELTDDGIDGLAELAETIDELLLLIGNLNDLDTVDQSSIVNAINEVNASKKTHHHTQSVALIAWPVNHNLGFRPSACNVTDSGGRIWECKLENVDDNNSIIYVGRYPFAGEADIG